MACRDFLKAELAAQRLGIPAGSYTIMHLVRAGARQAQRVQAPCSTEQKGQLATPIPRI